MVGGQLLWQLREHDGLSVTVVGKGTCQLLWQVREYGWWSFTVAGKRTWWAVSYCGR